MKVEQKREPAQTGWLLSPFENSQHLCSIYSHYLMVQFRSHGAVKAGNSRCTSPVGSELSMFPTDRKSKPKLNLKGVRSYYLIVVFAKSQPFFLPVIFNTKVTRE